MSIWVTYKLDPALAPVRQSLLSPEANARLSYARSRRRGR